MFSVQGLSVDCCLGSFHVVQCPPCKVDVIYYGLCQAAMARMARYAVLFLLVIFCLATAAAADDLLQILQNRTKAKYCGSNLSDVLSIVCRGRYNSPSPEARGKQANYRRKRDAHDSQSGTLEDNTFHFPFISKSNTEIFLARHKRQKRVNRGVYDECCKQACSYEVLKSYCA